MISERRYCDYTDLEIAEWVRWCAERNYQLLQPEQDELRVGDEMFSCGDWRQVSDTTGGLISARDCLARRKIARKARPDDESEGARLYRFFFGKGGN